MKATLPLAALLLAAAPAAAAQVTVTTVLESAKQTEPTPADRQFFAQGAQGAAYELKMAELAAQKAGSDTERRQFQVIADDDKAYLQALRDLAAQCYLDLDSPLSDDEEARVATLHALNGPAFDRAYKGAVSEAAAADTQLSDYEAATTFNPHIRELIEKYRLIRQAHQEQGK